MKKNIIVLISITLFWFGIAFFSKAMFSGFHLTDDHQIVAIHSDIQRYGLAEGFKKWVLPEVFQRLKPIRMTHKVLGTYFFGLNYTAWSIQTILAGVITSFMLYLFGLKINFSRTDSLLFVFLTLAGVQSMVWFHLGYDEMLGMLFLSFSLFCMAKSVYERKKLYEILFIVFAFLSSFSKESFVLIFPILIFWKNYLEKSYKNLNWLEVLKSNKYTNGILFFAFIASVILIKFVLKVDLGYASVSGITFHDYLQTILSFLKGDSHINFAFKPIIITVLSLIFIQKDFIKQLKRFFKNNYYDFIIFLLIILPQCFIYTKTGFFPRYILPASLGYSYLVVSLIRYFNGFNKSRIKKIILNAIIIVSVLFTSFYTSKTAYVYAIKGIYLYKTLDLVEQNTDKNSLILIVADPEIINFEPTISLQYYLKTLKNRDNVYLLPILIANNYTDNEFGRKMIQDLRLIFKDKTYNKIRDKNEIKMILVFSNTKDIFAKLSPSLVDIAKYERKNLKIFDVYIKNKK